MQWVLLAVIVGAILYLSRFYPKIAFSVLGALVLGVAVIVFTTTDVAQLKRARLAVEYIKVENSIIRPAYGGSFRFNARLINTHESITLKETTISITMLDCAEEADDATDGAACQVIGQEDERIIMQIPPGQVRDIAQTLVFGSAKLRGTLRWRIKITGTRS